jgi:hypothetical protein
MQINHHSQKEHTKISKLLQSLVEKYGKYSLAKFANFVYFCIGCENCETKLYKICKLWKAIFSTFYNILQPNFAILLILVCPSREYTFFAKIKN